MFLLLFEYFTHFLFQSFYPLKEAPIVEELVATVSETEKVNIKPLFNIDRDGNISDFLKKLYSQFYDGAYFYFRFIEN